MRMHAVSILDDVLGDVRSGRGGELGAAMRRSSARARRRADPRAAGDLAFRCGPQSRPAIVDGAERGELRDYGVGAQILLDLGVRKMTLLSNHKKTIVGLEGYGLTVEGQQAIPLDIS